MPIVPRRLGRIIAMIKAKLIQPSSHNNHSCGRSTHLGALRSSAVPAAARITSSLRLYLASTCSCRKYPPSPSSFPLDWPLSNQKQAMEDSKRPGLAVYKLLTSQCRFQVNLDVEPQNSSLILISSSFFSLLSSRISPWDKRILTWPWIIREEHTSAMLLSALLLLKLPVLSLKIKMSKST